VFSFLPTANCSQLNNMSDCILASYGKCAWNDMTGLCVEVSSFNEPDLTVHCASSKLRICVFVCDKFCLFVVFCLRHQSYNDCVLHNESCRWSQFDLCVPFEQPQIDNISIVNTTVTEVRV